MSTSVEATTALSEPEFGALVESVRDDHSRAEALTALLREDHPVYQQRSTAATVRMRGWVLLALARRGISDAELLFVLEELDTGADPYLVAAAARALRSYSRPSSEFAPFVMRAITNLRYRDDLVCLDRYGEYPKSSSSTSPVRELLATLAWLGPSAEDVLEQVERLRTMPGGLPQKLHGEVDKAVQAIRASDPPRQSSDDCCGLLNNMFSFKGDSRRESKPLEETVFQDQDGASLTFKEFFQGRPSIVVFFYTRCDNPLKCSLTVTKLARVQKMLESRGLAEKINTAAITYDPGFDLPDRLGSYGRCRGARLDSHHRMLRTTAGFTALRNHFNLGVNFVESLVNRHKVEAYVLDAQGRIAFCFERTHWDEQQVMNHASELLEEKSNATLEGPDLRPGSASFRTRGDDAGKISGFSRGQKVKASRPKRSPQIFGALAAIAVAFFPKCPMCWAAYLSMFGIASLQRIPYSPWLRLLFVAVMLVNLVTVWLRRRSIAGMTAFGLVTAGTLALLIFQLAMGWERVALWGVALTMAGSLLSVLTSKPAPIPAPQS